MRAEWGGRRRLQEEVLHLRLGDPEPSREMASDSPPRFGGAPASQGCMFPTRQALRPALTRHCLGSPSQFPLPTIP